MSLAMVGPMLGFSAALPSTVLAASGPADPAETTITVQAKDQYGNDLTTAGDAVTLSADHGTLSATTGTTDGSGQ